MAISFPSSPSNGQNFTHGNKVWTWDGNSWKGGVSSGGDAGTLDSLNSTQFLRSDANTSTSGSLGIGGRLHGGELGNTAIVRKDLHFYVDFNDKACVSGQSATEAPVDLSSSPYNLTLHGGANFEYKDGIGTYYFDGSGDHININDFVVADASNTYEVWHWSNAQSGWETFWDSGNERPLLGLYNNGLRAYPNSTVHATIDTGKWYHLVFAFASNNDLDVYVNGARVTEAHNWANTQRTGTFQFWLGGDTTHETTNGYIGIARAYTRQLTAQEVQQNYNAEVSRFAVSTPSLGVVHSGGNIGIGDTNPLYKLSVNNGTSDGGIFRLYNEEVGLNVAVDGTTGSPNYTNASRTVTFNATRFDAGTSPKLRLGGQGGLEFAADANNVRMVITNGGNVGINVASPSERLEVNGDALATSSFRIGDNSHWKIRGNNAYTELAFEYATSSGLSDANIKITMKPNGDLVVHNNLYVNGDFITLPTSATDPSGAVAGSMYYNTSSQNLKVYNGTRWGLIPADTIFDIFGDGSIEAFYEFNNNLNDTGGVHNMSVSDFQTTDGSGYVTGKSGMAWKVGFEDWLLYRGIGLGNASSWSLWCKDLNSEGSNSILFGAGVWNAGANGDLPGYGIFVDSSNNCYPFNKPGSTYNWTSTFTVSGWTHIAMTSGSNTIKTYVNGSLWNTKTSTTTATSINTLTAGRRLYHHDEDMAVTLDNVRIYNRVLTDAEVTQIYNLEN